MAKVYELSLHKQLYKSYSQEGLDADPIELWAFNDEARNIENEPFLTEASAAISALVGAWATKAKVQFSKKPFSGYQVVLKKIKNHNRGAWYSTFGGRQVWLCRVLRRYFWLRPKTIYASAQINYEG